MGHQVVQVMMFGYPAWSLFADEAVLAESINGHSAAASVRGSEVQAQTKCYSHTYRLIVQFEPI